MIPDFLKKENRKKADETDQRFSDAIRPLYNEILRKMAKFWFRPVRVRKYHEHFKNDGLMTEASSMSREEWIKVIEECI